VLAIMRIPRKGLIRFHAKTAINREVAASHRLTLFVRATLVEQHSAVFG
jgi:hypothetical protein